MDVYGVNPFTMERDPVMYLHYEGLAPSQIADRLGREREAVREHIVEHWSWDKKQRRAAK